jgi:hypothetical protein
MRIRSWVCIQYWNIIEKPNKLGGIEMTKEKEFTIWTLDKING